MSWCSHVMVSWFVHKEDVGDRCHGVFINSILEICVMVYSLTGYGALLAKCVHIQGHWCHVMFINIIGNTGVIVCS